MDAMMARTEPTGRRARRRPSRAAATKAPTTKGKVHTRTSTLVQLWSWSATPWTSSAVEMAL
ncbi:hypothetical protein ACFTWD_05180 [Streptomyces sp. NPDC056943]|uniref:hypothetical protein n=1 Tax=Streptomyces sp. NPDC056943 TaxID=3345971 RepID=UPI0036439B5E